MFKCILFTGAFAFITALAFTGPEVSVAEVDSELEYLLY
ncbi:hypothetical protein FIU95_14395 [Microbulbifer sp. THAF38]|nr:hypothetical protein FIU95_14395 [Microbulbifer sp. THAF38]